MHPCIRNHHELRNPPNGCKNAVLNGILEVKIYMDQLEVSYKRKKKSCMQTQKNFVRAQAIAKGVVLPYRFVLH